MSVAQLPVAGCPAEGETGGGLEIRLFGPMEVRVGGEPMARLHSRKGLWLLALLALRGGRSVERRWLAGTVWPESYEADALRSLRQSLHDLRKAMGPEAWRLHADTSRTLRLDLSGCAVDVRTFDAAIARGDEESLEAAVTEYRGVLLEGCAEEWVLQERAAREQAYLAALQEIASAAAARGDHTTSARYLRLAVAVDPYREDFQRALMEAEAGSDSPAGALMVYREFRELLQREMAAAPSEQTTALFQRLREEIRARATPRPVQPRLSAPGAAAPAHPPARLPVPLTRLIGRDEDVRSVASCLAAARLVTLIGTGGIGKTRLALQVAEDLCEKYPDGVRFVDLAPVADPGRVPDAVRAAVGVSPGDQGEAVEVLRRHLAPRRVLLVLDNCEHLVESCAALAETLLRHCPGVRVLATSRQPLGLRGETVWQVPPLLVPERDGGASGAGSIGQYPAILLFLERARAASPCFRITAGNAPALAQVCRRLDGIPLAIELAAARVRTMPVEQIAARLDDRFRLLAGRTGLPRHRTLRAAIDWSYDLLSEPERLLMERLSVFAGGWTLEAAEDVCGSVGGWECGRSVGVDTEPGTPIAPPAQTPIHRDEVLELLASVVEKSLVVYEERESGPRYRLLETVREYFRERGLEGAEMQTVRRRHAEYFTALAEEGDGHLTDDQQAAWLDRLETEHDNLRAALAASMPDTPHAGLGLRLAGALGHFWRVRGHLTEGREWLAQALKSGGPASTARGRALTESGTLALRQGDYDAARAFYEHALAIAREQGTRASVASALNNLGLVAYAKEDYPAARAFNEEALAVRRELGDRSGVASSLNNLGAVAYIEKDHARARALYEESLAIRRELGDRSGVAGSLNNLAVIASQHGEFETARSLCVECLAIRREMGDRWGVAMCLEALADVTCSALEPAASSEALIEVGRRAARMLGTAEALRERIGTPLFPNERDEYRRTVDRAREIVDAETFAAAWAEGRAMSMDEAVTCALEEAEPEVAP
jgi:non-specific serine/threonine protein kinase